jgi:hypothetical protein
MKEQKIPNKFKFLVKAPEKKDEMVLSFPFFIKLREEFPDHEINIITEEGSKEIYHYLNLDFKIFEIPKKEKNLLGIHRYAVNQSAIFNIDKFFDLENSLFSSFIGFSFRAKKRYGLPAKWSKYFINNPVISPEEASRDLFYLKLLDRYISKEITFSKFRDKNEQQNFLPEEFKSYILIYLDKEENFENMAKLVTSFEKQQFVFYSHLPSFDIQEFHKKLPPSPFIHYLYDKTLSYCSQYFLNAKGVISDALWFGIFSSYLKLPSFVFSSENLSIPQMPTFPFPAGLIIHKKENFILLNDKNEKSTNDVRDVVDALHLEFKL